MILWSWISRRLSQWVLSAVGVVFVLILLVEGVEHFDRTNEGFAAWWSLLGDRAPLVLRDLLALAFVVGAGGMVFSGRQRDFLGLSSLGVSRRRLGMLMGSVLLFWSLFLGVFFDKMVAHRSIETDAGWVLSEASLLHIRHDQQETPIAYSLVLEGSQWSRQSMAIDEERAQVLLGSRNLAESSLSELRSLSSAETQSWIQWRILGLFLPAVLGGFAVAVCLTFSMSLGWSLGVPLGLTLCVQVLGNLSAQSGWLPWLPIAAVTAAFASVVVLKSQVQLSMRK